MDATPSDIPPPTNVDQKSSNPQTCTLHGVSRYGDPFARHSVALGFIIFVQPGLRTDDAQLADIHRSQSTLGTPLQGNVRWEFGE